MKKTLKIGVFAAVISVGFMLPLLFSGCYSDTMDTLSNYTIQIPLNFTPKWRDRQAPDTSIDYTNLNNYKEYQDNKNKIKSSRLHQFAYWIDSIQVGQGDPLPEQVEFEFVRYWLFYYEGGVSKKYLLGEFKNVKVKDYYRIPHIIPVPDEVAVLAENITKKNPPDFYTIAEYGKITSGGSGRFPYIDSRFDLVIQLKVGF